MTNEELYYLPASELLKHIQAEKEHLIKEKVIKKSKPLPSITEEEKPYNLPNGWEWVRLGELINYQHGYAFKSKEYAEEGYPIIRMGNLVGGKSVVFSSKNTIYYSEYGNEKIISQYQVKKNDLLMCLTDMSPNREFLGNVAIYSENFISLLNQRVLKVNFIQNCVHVKLGQYILNSAIVREQLITKGSGSVQSNLSTDAVLNVKFPLPPLYIQDQIVQKLESLSEIKDSLLSHAESQLNYTKKMREALLQEAIRGELVPQDENDEPASVLLEKIKVEKERLIKEKVIKKAKELPPIPEEERPYELPSGWDWVRLGNVAQFNPRNKADDELLAGFIPMTLINDGFTNKHTFETRKWGEIKSGYTHFANNDVIFAKITPCFENRKSTIIKGLPNGIGSGTTEVITLRSYGETILPGYFLALINSPDFINNGKLTYLGTAGQQRVNAEFLKNYVFALPPLAEQERIVAKLDELMANCDQLEAKAEEMKNYTTKLFEVSLKEAFMPE